MTRLCFIIVPRYISPPIYSDRLLLPLQLPQMLPLVTKIAIVGPNLPFSTDCYDVKEKPLFNDAIMEPLPPRRVLTHLDAWLDDLLHKQEMH